MKVATLNHVLVENVIINNPLSLGGRECLISFFALKCLISSGCLPTYFDLWIRMLLPGLLSLWGPPGIYAEGFYWNFIFNNWRLKDFMKSVSICSEVKLYDLQSSAGRWSWQEIEWRWEQEVTAAARKQRLCLSSSSWSVASLFFQVLAFPQWAASREALGYPLERVQSSP